MHRFYLPPEQCKRANLVLAGREAHHALHVLRLNPDEPVTVLDGAGNVLSCKVESCSRNQLILVVEEKTFVPPLPCQITLLQAVPKGKIIENIIHKAVELGTGIIVPLLTERVTTRLNAETAAEKREKWQQVAIEAIKQCGAAWLPKIETPLTIETFLASQSVVGILPAETNTRLPRADKMSAARRQQFDLSLLGSLQPERRHPKKVIAEFQDQNGRAPKTVAVWIGPEGDFTPDELEMIIQSGALPISLGRLTLRVETAAIYCLSILSYELNSALESTP